jgi:hypothetical protein
MKKIIIQSTLLCSVLSVIFIACSKDDPAPVLPTIVKEWNIALSSKNENNPPAGRTETGTVNIQLLSDNTIKYTIAVTGLAAGDALTAAHIHTGDVISNGPVILGFNPVFNGGSATGTIDNIRGTFIDSLKNNVNELYFNVHSTQLPGGLLRGQLNTNIELAVFLTMSGANEVPPVTTTATGTALIRLTSDKKLYSKITVTNLEVGDALTAAHIHKEATGVNGPVIQSLCGGPADFGIIKTFVVSDALYTSLKTDAIYVNAHSTLHPLGIIRAQIR